MLSTDALTVRWRVGESTDILSCFPFGLLRVSWVFFRFSKPLFSLCLRKWPRTALRKEELLKFMREEMNNWGFGICSIFWTPCVHSHCSFTLFVQLFLKNANIGRDADLQAAAEGQSGTGGAVSEHVGPIRVDRDLDILDVGVGSCSGCLLDVHQAVRRFKVRDDGDQGYQHLGWRLN